MTSSEESEVRAQAFHLMTGHMAPGKDSSTKDNQREYNKRRVIYNRWLEDNSTCVRTMILAFQTIMNVDGDE